MAKLLSAEASLYEMGDEDMAENGDYKRKSRNLSEKKRRDQFNTLINEVNSTLAANTWKMDKSTILKCAINFLKTHNEKIQRSRIHEISDSWKPPFLSNEEFTSLMQEAVDGFIIVFSSCGKILHVSDNFSALMGYLPHEIENISMYSLLPEEDHSNLCQIFISSMMNSNMSRDREEIRVSFLCRCICKGSTYKDVSSLEVVKFTGYIRKDIQLVQQEPQIANESNYSSESNLRLLFIGTGQLQTPQLLREVLLLDTVNYEFSSHHNLEWKYIFIDNRASSIIGYSAFDILGTSGYDYYHMDDLETLVRFHNAVKKRGKSISGYYRFLTKGHQWIWLQTKCYVTVHQWLGKSDSIICTHRVVSFVDVPNDEWHSQSPCIDQTENDEHSFEKQSSISFEDSVSDITSESSSGCNTFCNVDSCDTQLQQLSVMPSISNSTDQIESYDFIQSSIESELQKKHEELQQMIVQSQEELHRVSEQLLMARCGIHPALPMIHLENKQTLYELDDSATEIAHRFIADDITRSMQ